MPTERDEEQDEALLGGRTHVVGQHKSSYRGGYRHSGRFLIRERLGGSANMMEPFPEKPKGMRYQTYIRMFWEHHEAVMEHLARTRKWLDKLQQRLS
jgi:hypothetical protein